MVFSEFKMEESIATPCSVNAIGKYLVPPRFEVAICDLKDSNSFIESSNIKSAGNLERFLLTCSFNLLVPTPYIAARSSSSMTL